MFSVGWRSGLCVTRFIRNSVFRASTTSKMGNCSEKSQPKVAPNEAKVVCRDGDIQEGEMVS